MRHGSINLTIDSQFQHVFLVGRAVQRICSSIPLSEQVAYEMELAVVEGVNNSIEHACHNQPGHPITVRMTLSDDRITFVVSDSGQSVESLPEMPMLDPTDPSHPPQRGRGLQIIRAVMDEVTYHTDGGSNFLTLIKYLPVAASGSP
jgi:anti-sigma regulatory factor (Ser/Thr protein kinase)